MPGDGLTIRQDGYVKAVLSGAVSKSAAARAAGYSPKDIHATASVVSANPKVIQAIERRKQGLRDAALKNVRRSIEKTAVLLEDCDDINSIQLVGRNQADIAEKLPEDAPPTSSGHEQAVAVIRSVYLSACRHALAGRIAPWAAAQLGLEPIATRDAPDCAPATQNGPGEQISGAVEPVSSAPLPEISQDMELAPLDSLQTGEYAARAEGEGGEVEGGEREQREGL